MGSHRWYCATETDARGIDRLAAHSHYTEQQYLPSILLRPAAQTVACPGARKPNQHTGSAARVTPTLVADGFHADPDYDCTTTTCAGWSCVFDFSEETPMVAVRKTGTAPASELYAPRAACHLSLSGVELGHHQAEGRICWPVVSTLRSTRIFSRKIVG